jgi:hypothetical protein
MATGGVRFVTEDRGSSGGRGTRDRGGPRKPIPRSPVERAQPSTPPPPVPRAPIRPVSPTNIPKPAPTPTTQPRSTIPFGPSAGAPRVTPAPAPTPAPKAPAPPPARVAAPPPTKPAPPIISSAPAPRQIDQGAVAVPISSEEAEAQEAPAISPVSGGPTQAPAPLTGGVGGSGSARPVKTEFQPGPYNLGVGSTQARSYMAPRSPYTGLSEYEARRRGIGMTNTQGIPPVGNISAPSIGNYRAGLRSYLSAKRIPRVDEIIQQSAANFPQWTRANEAPEFRSKLGPAILPTKETGFAVQKRAAELGTAGAGITGVPQATLASRLNRLDPVPVPRRKRGVGGNA